ncbi:MAG: hypothetical protein JWN51_3730, partial [Phycisphaerales bacterium]|nr:hypothetical protein [Phycisphaerales bacterium]
FFGKRTTMLQMHQARGVVQVVRE